MAALNKRAALGGAAALAAALLCASPAPAAETTAIMGFHGPEDFAVLPDGRSMLVANFYRNMTDHGGLVTLDLASGKIEPVPMTTAKAAGWGDASCTAPPSVLGPHGIDLGKRRDGKWQLLVVNHAERESIEFLEIIPAAGGATAIWRGCVVSPDEALNDVAATPEGGFVATMPVQKALRAANGGKLPAVGMVSGYNVEWRPDHPLAKIPGSEAPFNNGVAVSKDGKTLYYTAWTGKEVRRVDRATNRQTGATKLDFMPDNFTWRADGKLVAAGIDQLSAEGCPKVDDVCAYGFGVAAIDPATMKATPVYHADAGLMSGVSTALQVGDTLYAGSFAGSRITKIKLGK